MHRLVVRDNVLRVHAELGLRRVVPGENLLWFEHNGVLSCATNKLCPPRPGRNSSVKSYELI